jgi:MFS family permease
MIQWNNFNRFWAAQSVSMLGTQVTLLALPLVAIVTLGATPAQLGILVFLQTLPAAIFSLPAGVLADHFPRKRMLVIADVMRAVALAGIPAAAYFEFRTMYLLYVIGFITGSLSIIYQIAYQSFIPALVPKSELVSANGRLEMSRSVAQLVGPSIAATLVALVGPVISLLANVVSFFATAAITASIKTPEGTAQSKPMSLRYMLAQIIDGFAKVREDQRLLALMAGAAIFNFFYTGLITQNIFFLVRVLEIPVWGVSAVMTGMAVGLFVGASAAKRLASRFGYGPCLIFSALAGDAALLVLPFSQPGSGLAGIALLIVAFGIFTFGVQVYNVCQVSYRQAAFPSETLGRINGTMRFVAAGAAPLGAILSGWTGDTFGARIAIAVCVVGLLVAPLVLYLSPIRTTRKVSAA